MLNVVLNGAHGAATPELRVTSIANSDEIGRSAGENRHVVNILPPSSMRDAHGFGALAVLKGIG